MGNKFITYVFLMLGVSLLFYFGGLVNSNPLIELALHPEQISVATWVIITISGLGGVAAVVYGIVTRRPEIAIYTILVPALFTILWNFGAVILVMYGENPWVTSLIFGPLMVVFVMSGIDYWGGRD